MKLLRRLCIICVTLLIISVTAAADSFAMGETYRQDFKLTDGVTESTVYVTLDSGFNVRAHILRMTSDSNTEIRASYGNYYGSDNTAESREKNVKGWNEGDWTFKSVRNQAREYGLSADKDGEVIAASNGDFFDVHTGEPEGSLVMEGSVIKRNKKRPFFAVLKNGNPTIRKAGSKITDTAEVIGGDELLLYNGKYATEIEDKAKPREAIGVCRDGTVVIVSIDGREPASVGATRKELAQIMKKQGCQSALNLDGGGSASFMTKRKGDVKLKFRSNHSDGPERQVGSALLIIEKYAGTEGVRSGAPYQFATSMSDRRTALTCGSDGRYRYVIKGKAQTGFFSINEKTYLFSKGKGLTKRIKIGNVTYNFRKGLLKSSSDRKAGNVIIGYYGADGNNGQNLIYAYHEGDKRLIIGVNPLSKKKSGKMKNLKISTLNEMPWYSVRMDIKKVYVGNGVTNLGDFFLFSTKGALVGGATAPRCMLGSIRLPSSLKKIGSYSLYNKPKLHDLSIPAKVTKIGNGALMYSGRRTLKFKGENIPSFGKNALKNSGFSTIYLKQSSAWKSFVKNKGLRKYGFTKSVRYF